MKLTKVEDAILVEGNEDNVQEIIDLLEIVFGIKEAKTPEELMTWNARVQPLFQEMLEEAFGRLLQHSRVVRSNRLHEALVILQGGQ